MIDKLIEKYCFEEYKTKEEIKYRIERNIDIDEFWEKLILARRNKGIETNLFNKSNNNYWFVVTDNMRKNIKYIDDKGKIPLNEMVLFDKEDVLIEESLSSSAIEGIFSTRSRFRSIVEDESKIKTKEDKMLLNNYEALQYIMSNNKNKLSHDFIIDVWKIITKNTLDDVNFSEGYRRDKVYIGNASETVFEGVDADKISLKMDDLISIFNDEANDIPSVIKASVFHYYFVYIHPFYDGNGRTARALTSMYLLKSNYNFFEFISISQILKNEKGKYYKAIKNSENQEGDLTYFVEYYLDLLKRTIEYTVSEFVEKYFVKYLERGLIARNIHLNKRQIKILDKMMNNTNLSMTVKEYMKIFSVVQETARKDLKFLQDIGVMNSYLSGKTYYYRINNIEDIIKNNKE